MASNIPVIVQGNSFNLAIPLQIYVINGDQMELQDYTPYPTDQISIQLKGSRRNYTYTPTSVTDNVCMIALGGYELADNYSVVVSIVKANGQRLRSFRTDQFFIVESSDDLTQDDIIQGLEENVIYLNAQAFIAGADGRGIESIIKTSTSGLVDTYTITYSDATTSTFNVTNGAQGEPGATISSVEKTATAGLVDTYTITMTDGNTFDFEVTNGKDGLDGVDIGLANIVNDLITGGATNVLSAEMGKVLNTYNTGGSESETYPWSEVTGTGNAISLAGYAVMQNKPTTIGGTLTELRFKRLNGSGNAKVIILDSDKKVVSNTQVAVTSTTTDLTSYNITVEAGQYIAVAAIKNGASGDIRTLNATGVEYGYFPGDKAVGAASGYTSNGAKKLDFEVDIEYNAGTFLSVKDKVTDNANRITSLETKATALDIWNTRHILHIGTSISDGVTAAKCYWFSKAMELLNCPSANYHNTAKSGQNARYFAQNYDTLIAPYISGCYLFTIEHGINDRTVIASDDVSKMTPDLTTYPDTLGFDIQNSYYGAMAYIITRARSENMGIKIAIIGHWREGTDNWASTAGCLTAQQNVSETMCVPLLRLWDFMGATAQEVTWSGEIYGTAYSGTKTIRQWYSTCPPSWNGDGLHPFNPIAQDKYASIYAGWVQSW